MRYLWSVFLMLVMVTIPAHSCAAPKGERVLRIKELMEDLEFSGCGLNRLSVLELKALDEWLNAYTRRVIEVTYSRQTENPSVIESRIDGEFEGWDGETIFKLDNGQIWQQASYDYTYEYAYSPEVLIYKTAGGYKMRVEGVDDTIYVKRLK